MQTQSTLQGSNSSMDYKAQDLGLARITPCTDH
jgi:hypothetical protein